MTSLEREVDVLGNPLDQGLVSGVPCRPSAELMNADTRLIDGVGSAVQRKRLSERGGDLDIFYRLMLPLRAAEDTGVWSRGRETQINTDCLSVCECVCLLG